MQLRVSLADVSGGCSKPNCGHRAPLNRHHKRHEALWLGPWAWRNREPKYSALVLRYHQFLPEDTVTICLPHHAEIHSIYDRIIQEDRRATGLPLYKYSWRQGRILMKKLEAACNVWLLQETPGLDSQLYEKNKALYRGLMKKRAKKRRRT